MHRIEAMHVVHIPQYHKVLNCLSNVIPVDPPVSDPTAPVVTAGDPVQYPHTTIKCLQSVSLANLPESLRKQGKQQVFLQTVSEPPAVIQAKQHAFARELSQQLHSAAVAELTAMLRTIRQMSTTEVRVLVSLILLPSIFSLPGAATTILVLGFVLRCAFGMDVACRNL